MLITKAERFINQLENTLKHQFDVYANDKLENLPLRFSAHYYRRDDRYMFTKNVTVWSVENNQHIFLYEANEGTIEEFEQFKQELDCYIHQHKSDRTSHMSSIYIGIFLLKTTPSMTLEKKAKRTRKVSFIQWGKSGWYERYLGVLSIPEQRLIINKKGNPFIQPFIEAISE
ncbi:hypothetical protein ACE1TH_09080 [Shouchella sp. JSM 1781072]|uniref:hypothetical protein n=1 Tax=Bacillaceae TaxID=186817 RepID=UPI000C0796ED|nr:MULTISPECIES: hypothetical protein [Bacillaceae]UTR07750.1 hypothetical protein MM326_06975 [Alkalihalobacillus sp. LMS6]